MMPMMYAPRTQQAFSLVELSIVLVILGLLAGGILSGQSLIRAAELRSVTTQYGQYMAAMQSFRDKYFALPGDMNNAVKFWNSAGGSGDDAACIDAQQTAAGKATCNGNGDGQILTTAGYDFSERFLAWRHLANAGLVEGNYKGKTTGAKDTYEVSLGGNVPAAKISNGYFDISYIIYDGTFVYNESHANRNAITIYGNVVGTTSSWEILKPEEAWNIDTKFDDGDPVYGNVFTHQKDATSGKNCTDSNAAPAHYDVQANAVHCILHFAAGS